MQIRNNNVLMCPVSLRVWDSRTWQVTNTFPAKQYIQTHCDISSNCYHLLSASNGFGGQGCEATVSVNDSLPGHIRALLS